VIWIKKPAQAPAVLLSHGVSMTRELCEQYDADAEAYKNGSKRVFVRPNHPCRAR
jgi:hypothetical protein